MKRATSLPTLESNMRQELLKRIHEQEEAIKKRMAKVRYKIAIISGKGGVGKSFISANLSVALATMNRNVGVLDVDFHGPSIPKLLGLQGRSMIGTSSGLLPVIGPAGVKVASIDFMLPSEETPVIWRGPLKANVLRELLSMIDWGDLDYLIVDLPPGTGDEPLSVAQLIRSLNGAIVVTIPSDLSRVVVKKAISFAKQLNIKLLGIVENMSYFVCPKCGSVYKIFGERAGESIAKEMKINLLGKVPLDPRVSECMDKGEPITSCCPESEATKVILKVARTIIEMMEF